ncbi:MAG: flagellar basal body rod protein FlgB [Calditrichaeota bacterium]|nr:flagellar basal body rod protein FlgB [Calditrichota bacterium]
MIKNFILKQTKVPLLSKGLDVYALRQKVIASNIANVNTPGYRRKEVVFEEKLQTVLQRTLPGRRTHPRHMPIGPQRMGEVQPEIQDDPSNEFHSGANNVDIDREIVEQVKNEIRFLYGVRLLQGNFRALRASIKGRFDQ